MKRTILFAILALTLILLPSRDLSAQNKSFLNEDTTYVFNGEEPFMMTCCGIRHDAFHEGTPDRFFEVHLFKSMDRKGDRMSGTVYKQNGQEIDAFLHIGSRALSYFICDKTITESTLRLIDGRPYMITSSREIPNQNTMDFSGFLFLMRSGAPVTKFSDMTMLAYGNPLRVVKTEYENDGITETYSLTLENEYHAIVSILLDDNRTPQYLDVSLPEFRVKGFNDAIPSK